MKLCPPLPVLTFLIVFNRPFFPIELSRLRALYWKNLISLFVQNHTVRWTKEFRHPLAMYFIEIRSITLFFLFLGQFWEQIMYQ